MFKLNLPKITKLEPRLTVKETDDIEEYVVTKYSEEVMQRLCNSISGKIEKICIGEKKE